MRAIGVAMALLITAALSPPAVAYSLKSHEGSDGCNEDGGSGGGCEVYCDNGDLAGVMYFNGNGWTDGVASFSTDMQDAIGQVLLYKGCT